MLPDGQGNGSTAIRRPPKKLPGQAKGRRSMNGVVKDVSAMGSILGTTDGKIRSAVARGLLPYRRWGKRLVFLSCCRCCCRGCRQKTHRP